MRAMLLAAAIVASAALLPSALAQASEGSVQTTVQPRELTLDPPAQVRGEPYTITVRVQGSIDCVIGLQKPVDVFVEASGSTALQGTQNGDTVTFFGLEVRNFTVSWQPDPTRGGRYKIDATREIEVINDAAPPSDYTATIEWGGQQLDQSGTRCNTAGYHWTIDAQSHTILVPSFRCVGDDCSTLSDGDGDEGTPIGAWLPFAAIGVAFFLGRRARE